MTEVRKKSKLMRRENIAAFAFIIPPLVGFLVFTIGAMFFTFIYSFQDFNVLTGESHFEWSEIFKNYETLFTNSIYSKSFFDGIKNTCILLLSIPLNMILGLGLAALLKMGQIKGSKVFQVLYYLPAVSSAVAMNIIWRYIFNNEFGIINQLLGVKIEWLSDATLIKIAIIIKNSLSGMGGAMILFLAGMLNVPKDYYEAADLDGASKVSQFFKITLPLITPIIFYLLITGLIGGFQSYADAQVFAAGNKGAQTIVFFIWQRGIHQHRYGLASAASIILAFAIMVFTVIQFKVSDKWVYED